MFGIFLLVFIGLCIYHACEPTIPADYHKNWKLESQDADKVRFGEMSQREFSKNIRNGKYRQISEEKATRIFPDGFCGGEDGKDVV